jgi:hypothetical protein
MANTFVTPMYASRSSTVDHAAAASDGPGGSTDSVDSPKIPTGHATAPTCADDDFGKSSATQGFSVSQWFRRQRQTRPDGDRPWQTTRSVLASVHAGQRGFSPIAGGAPGGITKGWDLV